MKNSVIIIVLYLLLISFISYYVGNKIYNLESKEALAYVFYYILFVLFYILLTGWLLLKKITSHKLRKQYLMTVFFSWIPIIAFPLGSIFLLQNQAEIREIAVKKEEQNIYIKNLSAINQSIESHLDSAELYIERARVYRSNGLYENAIADSKKSIELKLTQDGLWELGWNYEIIGEFDKAKRIYLKAKNHFPNEEWVNIRLGVVSGK